MFKKNMIAACCMISSVVGWSAAEAKITLSKTAACAINLNHMPQYKTTFTLPKGEDDAVTRYIVLRFYQPWGDGSSTGWQLPLVPPTATMGDEALPIRTVFAYSSTYGSGALYLGFDQYAQYYAVGIPYTTLPPDAKVTITSPAQQAAYLSATLYIFEDGIIQQTILDKEMEMVDNECNPYVEGNPSVFSYPATTTQNLFKNLNNTLDITPLLQRHSLKSLPKALVKTSMMGEIPVYRLDQESSEGDFTDDIAPDGCSRAYLVAYKSEEQKVVILRIKVPTTFIENNHPDKIFGKYQARYFSVASHRTNPADQSEQLLTYWSVNARMLKEYMDEDGYAYVFFAPHSYTNELARQQNTPETQPPVMTWGKYKGYLLGEPDFAIIMRYRDPDLTWKGTPENAICYNTQREAKPVTKEELGNYLPEIYGDTMENFQNGKIGAVNKDGAWPGK